MKTATVALVVRFESDMPLLTEILSDEDEIEILSQALAEGAKDPLTPVHDLRNERNREENEFSDYVEDLVSQPFVKRDVQEHGLQWLRSKIRIENYQKTEAQAAQVIADYAYRIYRENPGLKDFFLSGPNTRVRVRIFVLPERARVRAA